MISNEDLGKLSKLIEKSFVSALIANKYATLRKDNLKIENLIISPEIIETLEIGDVKPNNTFLDTLINLYPKEQFSCSKKVLADRLEVFYKKTTLNNVTEDEIIDATKIWLATMNYPYFGTLPNFIFKYDKTKTWHSRLENTILELRVKPQKIVMGNVRDL